MWRRQRSTQRKARTPSAECGKCGAGRQNQKPMAEAITTAARALLGKALSRLGASSNSNATATAPTTPVSCVFAPAASATGVAMSYC